MPSENVSSFNVIAKSLCFLSLLLFGFLLGGPYG